MKILDELRDAVGEANVSADVADLVSYSRDEYWPYVPPHNPDYVVRPSSTAEVQKVVRIANRFKIPLVPRSTGINRKGFCIPSKGGILLDLKRMNRILEVDDEMITATVEPGVTFGQLNAEAGRKGLRAATPDAPLTVSVLANNTLRGLYQTAARHGFDHVLTMEVVLPDGELLKTGSSALPNGEPYCGPVNGPDLSYLFRANPGIMGVVTKMTVKLYPQPEFQEAFFITFKELAPMIEVTRDLMRGEVVEALRAIYVGKTVMGWYLEVGRRAPPEFYILASIGGDRDHFELNRRALERVVSSKGGVIVEGNEKSKEAALKDLLYSQSSLKAWGIKGSMSGLSFYAPLKKAPKYIEVFREVAERHGKLDDVAFYISPYGPTFHGQLCYQDYLMVYDTTDPDDVRRVKKINDELIEVTPKIGFYGWFRPFPGVIEKTNLGTYGQLWRSLKELLDPNGIMNPGKVFSD